MTIKHGLIWKILIAVTLIVMALFATTRVASQITEKSGDVVNSRLNLTDMAFFAGNQINLKISSTDDIFAAGGSIISDNTSADHLVLAGGQVTVNIASVKDIFIAGGKIDLASGTLSDDLVAAGGEVDIRSGLSIGGSAVVSGNEVRIDAPIKMDLRAAAGSLYVNSAVGGDAKLMGDVVELGPKARIGGNLQYRTGTLKISPEAIIGGTKTKLPAGDYAEFERWGKDGAWLLAFFALTFIAGMALLVVAITLALPGLMSRAATAMREKWLQSVGTGLLVIILVPITLFMLFATVIGVPLAMLIVALLMTAMPLAFAATAYFLGTEVRRMIGKKPAASPLGASERLLWPSIAVVIILLLGMIPYLGGLVWLVALIFGLGALIVSGGKAIAPAALQ